MEDLISRENEISQVEQAIQKERERGNADEATKHARVRRGIYSMRAKPGRYVIRVRLPAGILTAPQVGMIAEIVEKHGAPGYAHLTTRQGIEIADVPGQTVGGLLRTMESAGITTSRTGGNVIRNIVCCPLSGIEPREAFDVTPFALSLDAHLRDHPDCQAFPRKVKIAFEGCPTDHVRTTACDIGLHAKRVGSQRGFHIRVAGGLGSTPMVGQALEEFTPLPQLVPTVEAILRVFNRKGNRSDRAHARMKWLVRSQGIDKFRRDVLQERDQLPPSRSSQVTESEDASAGVKRSEDAQTSKTESGFENWKSFNTLPQKQAGALAAWVYVPLGNLTPAQLRVIAQAVRRFSTSPPRLSIEQNVLLRGISKVDLPELHRLLASQGLGGCCAGRVMDITRCVGSTCCLSAITNPVAAARALEQLFRNGLAKHPRLQNLRIRVSGCPNSCSHHYAADIGLFGASKRLHERPAPHYALVLGGQADGEHLGKRIVDIPARQLVPAIDKLFHSYLNGSAPNESFREWTVATGAQGIKSLLGNLLSVPAPVAGPEFYRDLEETSEFSVQAKEGECSA